MLPLAHHRHGHATALRIEASRAQIPQINGTPPRAVDAQSLGLRSTADDSSTPPGAVVGQYLGAGADFLSWRTCKHERTDAR